MRIRGFVHGERKSIEFPELVMTSGKHLVIPKLFLVLTRLGVVRLHQKYRLSTCTFQEGSKGETGGRNSLS